MGDSVRADGIVKARQRLVDLAARLREAASGGVVARAAQAVQAQVDKVAHRIASEHKLTGAADAALVTTSTGALVQLRHIQYLGFHAWWPFRSGMPPFVVSRAARIFKAELEAAVSGQRSPLLLADAAAEEKSAAKSRAQFKRDIARAWRNSAEGRAARRAAAKKRAEERAIDRRTKAREDRE